MKILNTYDYKGEYYKGNLHTHTNNSPCGHYTTKEVIDMYTSFKIEYDFLAITDHYKITDLSEFYRDDIILFSGIEFKKSDKQTLGINLKENRDDELNVENHKWLFKDVENQGGINIICHPHFARDNYWTYDDLVGLDNYTGIEVFNNNVRMDVKGRSIASDLWDELLSSGKRIFGFANDDMHLFSRVGGACNYVLADEKSGEGILEGIKRGSFYASFGVKIENIKVQDNTIFLEKGDKRTPYVYFKFIGKNGVVLKEDKGVSSFYKVKGNEGYVRVEVYREDGSRAWTQPFFIEE